MGFSNLLSKWQKLRSRERFLVLIFLLLIIGYLSYIVYFKSQMVRLSSLRQELDQATKKYETALAEGWDDIPYLKSQIERTKERIEELQIPTSNDTAELLVELYELALKYNLYLDSDNDQISFGDLESGDYFSYEISLELVGRSSDIYGFLHEVQHSERFIAIDKGVIRCEEPGQLKCALTLKVFLFAVEKDSITYPFMSFKPFMNESYTIFKPSLLETESASSS